MSLKTELQAIDAETLTNQAFAYDDKIEDLPDDAVGQEAETQADEYKAVNMLVGAAYEVFARKPDFSEEDLMHICLGASFVLSVLTEYAEVQDLPDITG